MKNRLLLIAVLCLNSLATILVGAQPNIIIMLIDDMGMMDTSLPFLTDENGKPKRYPLNDYYRTPNMERLAARGIRFNNFYAMSVCSPTRISLMTGQNAARHRTTNWINPDVDNAGTKGAPDWNWRGLNSQSITLARLLQSSGYRTIHIGKGHFGPRDTEGADPRNLGFDVNIGGASIGAPATYYASQNFSKSGKKNGNAVLGLEKYHGKEMFLTEALTLEAENEIEKSVAMNKPFFLYLPHYAVHSPFDPDSRFIGKYKDSGKSPPAQAFATLIEGIDRSLGVILERLEALGIAEETLVFFLGDNGSDAPLGHEHAVACAAPLRGKKGSHYEGGVRVPFIAAWGKPNSKNEIQQRLPIATSMIQSQTAAVYDLFPTILELIGQSTPSEHAIDGSSLKDLLSGSSDPTHDRAFLMHYPHGPHRSSYFTTFRDGDWKVIYHYFPSKQSEGGHFQLFNLADDPFESTNLADKELKKLRELMTSMLARLESQSAVFPVDGANRAVRPSLP
jgi:arylsulfatase A-like enzyme